MVCLLIQLNPFARMPFAGRSPLAARRRTVRGIAVLMLGICLAVGVVTPAWMQTQPTGTEIPVNTLPDARVLPLAFRLRVRGEPNTESPILGIVEPETPLEVVGRSSGGVWLQVLTPEAVTGWLLAEYLDVRVNLDAVPVTFDQSVTAPGSPFAPRVQERIRAIYAAGLERDNRPGVFSKIGDSITVAPHMYTPISVGRETGDLYLGEYEYLLAAVDTYRALEARPGRGDSFGNPSLAAGIGWTTSALYDTDFRDPEYCREDETPLECEYRVVQPTVALIMLGTNDVSSLTPATYYGNLAGIVDFLTDHGVIPVLSTIPNRAGYEDQVVVFNDVIRGIANDFAIPLWDYGGQMQTLPGGGLAGDGVHPSIPPNGTFGSADFHRDNLAYGYVLRNLTALQMLDAVLRTISETS